MNCFLIIIPHPTLLCEISKCFSYLVIWSSRIICKHLAARQDLILSAFLAQYLDGFPPLLPPVFLPLFVLDKPCISCNSDLPQLNSIKLGFAHIWMHFENHYCQNCSIFATYFWRKEDRKVQHWDEMYVAAIQSE